MKKILVLLLLITNLFVAAGCSEKSNVGKEEEVPTFKIGAIPDQNAADLNRSLGKMADYLAEKTGLEVEYVPSVDYAALVTAFERGEIQLAWFGGLTGVQARAAAPTAEAIAQRPKDETFKSVFIAQKGLNIKSLTDLKGKSVTFGSESSTSGHLMPRYFMMEAGVNPDTDLNGKPNYSGSHDKSIKLVESGAFQVAAVNISVWEQFVAENNVDLEKVEVVYTTPDFFDYNWTINDVDGTYGKGTKAKVTDAILSMGENEKEILELFTTDRFIPTKNDNYQSIEKVAKAIGIIK